MVCPINHNNYGELSSRVNSEKQTIDFVRNSQGYIETINLEDGDQITYHLDHRDRRVAKYKNGNLVYKRLYQNELQVAMQINADNSLSQFIYATKINVPDLIKKDGQVYRVIADHLGSPVLVLNIADGTIVAQAHYNEWGRVTEQTNSEFMPFSFAGGLRDLDTGLVRFGARDYSPQTARWISKNPIGFNGGDANLYRYVGNDPVNFYDPRGETRDAATMHSEVGGGGYMVVGGLIVPLSDLGDTKVYSKQKGERNKTAKPEGTNNLYKKMRPHPTKPNKVQYKDPHTGQWKEKTKPDGFDEY